MPRARLLLALAALLAAPARAQDAQPQLVIRDHRFTPPELHVPAGKRVTIDVRNDDSTAEEFDSADLGVEKVIPGGREVPVRLRPLVPGRYAFSGEYHPDTAQGVVIAEPGE